MNIVNSYLTNNPCYKANRKIEVKGLMLHSVGCSQPHASVFVRNWNNANYDRACVHAFIDAIDGNVYQCLPWNHRGWHGGGSSNNTHIGVEMCEPDCIKYIGGSTFDILDKARAIEMTKRTYNSAVELFAMLCKEYNLNPLTNIVSHSEGYKLGIASNHGDPEHLWKQLGLSYTMDTFRQDVNNKLNNVKQEVKQEVKQTSNDELYRVRKSWQDTKSQIGAYKIYNNAVKACKEGYSIYNKKGECVYTNSKSTSTKKTNEEIAKEVIQGKWGNGVDRKNKLTAAGYDYTTIQSIVNKMLK